MSVNLETPLGLSAFLGANANLHKVYVPATYSMGKVLEGLETQKSSIAVVDSELFDLDAPENRSKELRH